MPPVPARSFPLTAEELTLVCEIVGLGEPLGVGLLPLDHDDAVARELMLATSLRSLAGRGLLAVDGDGEVELDPVLTSTIELLAGAPCGVSIRATGEESSADIALAFDEGRCSVLVQRGLLDYSVYAFTSVADVDLLAYALAQTFLSAAQGMVVATRVDSDGVRGEELAWRAVEDGKVEVSSPAVLGGENGDAPSTLAPAELAARLIGAA